MHLPPEHLDFVGQIDLHLPLPAALPLPKHFRTQEFLAERTLKTILNDINIFSVSPLVMFDVARLGPASADGRGGYRYGLGGGVRFVLVSHVAFDLGYAWNLRRKGNEPVGALFFGMTFRDLFE